MANSEKITKPYLVLIRGLPGSGKSFIADQLKNQLSDDVYLLDPDATDYESQKYIDFSKKCLDEGVDLVFHPYRFLRAQAYAAIDNEQIVVWNQAFTNFDGLEKTVNNLKQYALAQKKDLPVLIVEVRIDYGLAKQRVAKRSQDGGHNVSDQEFDRFIRDYHSFEDKGLPIIKIDGQAEVNHSVKKIMAKLTKS